MGFKTKEQRREYDRKNYLKNKEKILERNRLWKENNKELISAYNHTYGQSHKEEKNIREKKRRDEDPIYRMKLNLRRINRRSIKNFKLRGNSKLLGCSYEEIREHLTKQFTIGMSWDNYGEWHIDHIIPLASATTEDEVLKLYHYSNLQPLWAIDNIRKGSKIIS